MAGQLTVDSLKASSGVLATQNGMTGIAKAWVNFNGTGTVAIRSSFNVSSITDNGTGNYTINFTTAMPDANYALVAICDKAGTTDAIRSVNFMSDLAYPATTSCRIGIAYAVNTPIDSLIVSAAVLGN